MKTRVQSIIHSAVVLLIIAASIASPFVQASSAQEDFSTKDIATSSMPILYSYFDGTDMEGWTLNLGSLQNPGEGGSGGGIGNGFLQTTPPRDNLTSYFVAPTQYHGDWSTFTELRFDMWSYGGTYNTSGYSMYGDVYLENNGKSAQMLLPRRPAATWDRFIVRLDGTENWTFGGGATSLQEVLNNVTDFQLRAEYGVGVDHTGLDNVEIFGSLTTGLFSISGQVADGSGNGIAGVTVTAIRYPIILLPGVMGTALSNNPNNTAGCLLRPRGEVWLNLVELFQTGPVPGINDIARYNYALGALKLEERGDQPDNGCDSIRASGLIDETALVEWFKDYYKGFKSTLTANNFTVLEYPGYDWRLDLEVSAKELDAFIDKNKGSAGKVILIGHSMGGLLARSYIADKNRAAKVAKVISVGSPYWGAPVLAHRMRSGQTGLAIDYIVFNSIIQDIIRNSPGAMQLLPSRAYVEYGGYYMDESEILGSYDNIIDFFVRSGQNKDVLGVADEFHKLLDDFRNIDDLVDDYRIDYYILAAAHMATPSLIREFRCQWSIGTCFTVTGYLMGDETVPMLSSRLGGQHELRRGKAKVCTYGRGSVQKGHSELLVDVTVRADVLRLLRGEPPTGCTREWQTVVRSQEILEGFRQIVVWGEDRVRVVNESGQFTGVDESGLVVRDLTDVNIEFTDGGVILTIPAASDYKLEITQQSEMDMAVEAADFGRLDAEDMFVAQARAIFANVPSQPDGLAVFENTGVPLTELEVILMDAEGNLEQTMPPDGVLKDPVQLQDTTMPTTTLTIQGSQNAQGAYTGSVTATISAVDDNAGVLKSYYSLDAGQSWQEYSTPVQIAPGQATSVQAYSVDRAGNREYPPKVESLIFVGESRIYLPFTTRGIQQRTTSVQDPLLAAELQIDLEPQPAQQPVLPVQPAAATQVYTAITGTDGRYTLSNLPAGHYEVTAEVGGWTMTPSKRTVTVPPDHDNITFVATPSPGNVNGGTVVFADSFLTDPNMSGQWRIHRQHSGDTANEASWDVSEKVLYLTRAVNNRAVAMFADYELTEKHWQAEFRYRVGGGSGADGFVFMFYKDESSYGSPGTGGVLGFGSGGIPGYGVEFDGWKNIRSRPEHSDPSANHVALISRHTGNHLVYKDDLRTKDNKWHDVLVEYDHGHLTVKIDEDVVLDYIITDPDYTYTGIGFSALPMSIRK